MASLRGDGAVVAGVLVLVVVLAVAVLWRVDRTQALGVVFALLLLIPARERIAPLNSAGTPAAILGVGCFAVWLVGTVTGRPRLVRAGRRSAGRCWPSGSACCSATSPPACAARTSWSPGRPTAGCSTLVSALGVALLAAELPRDWRSLQRLVAVIGASGSVVALLGVTQFLTGRDVAGLFRLPGFTFVAAGDDTARAGFTRVVSTTSHPIELAVVLVMVLPLVMWSFFTSVGRARRRWAVCLAVVGTAVPMTVSRTGIVGLVVALAVVVPTWSWRRRRRAAVVGGIGLLGGVRALVPGLIGTLRSFLLDPGNDPSLLSRQIGRQRALDFLARRPVLGRGFGTFLPERYGYLDNQVLLGAVETGVLGQAAYAGVFAVAAVTGVRIAREVPRGPLGDAQRSLAISLLAALAVSLSSWFTFDALSFPTSRGLTFVCLGLLAALARVALPDRRSASATVAPAPEPTVAPAAEPTVAPAAEPAVSPAVG